MGSGEWGVGNSYYIVGWASLPALVLLPLSYCPYMGTRLLFYAAQLYLVLTGIVITNFAPSPADEMHSSVPPCFSVMIW